MSPEPPNISNELWRKLNIPELIKRASPKELADSIKVLMFVVQDSLLFHFHNTTGALGRLGKSLPDQEHLTLRSLFVSCHMSSESVLYLMQCERLWDGERLMRSIYEGTIKMLYMCQGSPEERGRRTKEYREDYPGMEAIRRQQRLEIFFKEALDPQSMKWEPLRQALLPQAEFEALLQRFPGKERARLTKQWSFAELLRAISNEKDALPMASLLHTYGIGSSLLHHDSDAINITRERTGRDDARRLSVEAAHGGRLLSDLLTMVHIRSESILKVLNADTAGFKERVVKDNQVAADIGLIQKAWWAIESQNTNLGGG